MGAGHAERLRLCNFSLCCPSNNLSAASSPSFLSFSPPLLSSTQVKNNNNALSCLTTCSVTGCAAQRDPSPRKATVGELVDNAPLHRSDVATCTRQLRCLFSRPSINFWKEISPISISDHLLDLTYQVHAKTISSHHDMKPWEKEHTNTD